MSSYLKNAHFHNGKWLGVFLPTYLPTLALLGQTANSKCSSPSLHQFALCGELCSSCVARCAANTSAFSLGEEAVLPSLFCIFTGAGTRGASRPFLSPLATEIYQNKPVPMPTRSDWIVHTFRVLETATSLFRRPEADCCSLCDPLQCICASILLKR